MEGESATFSVSATGLNLNYEWQFSTQDLIPVTTQSTKYMLSNSDATLTIMDVEANDVNDYRVRVFNDGGSVDSSSFVLELSKTHDYISVGSCIYIYIYICIEFTIRT